MCVGVGFFLFSFLGRGACCLDGLTGFFSFDNLIESLLQEISLEVLGLFCWVQIKDSGCGVSPQDIPHLFTKFICTRSGVNRSQGGSGLGLAICKR